MTFVQTQPIIRRTIEYCAVAGYDQDPYESGRFALIIQDNPHDERV